LISRSLRTVRWPTVQLLTTAYPVAGGLRQRKTDCKRTGPDGNIAYTVDSIIFSRLGKEAKNPSSKRQPFLSWEVCQMQPPFYVLRGIFKTKPLPVPALLKRST
ncbi:unnamed protein product, partial [Ectocarpus fasciculatus]